MNDRPQQERDEAELQSYARQLVWEIRDLYRELPDVIASLAGLHATRYDRGSGGGTRRTTDTTLIGGDAMLMYAPGNTDPLPPPKMTHIDKALLEAERQDPPSVTAVLATWEDAWRVERGDPAATSTSLADTVTYLTTHTTWASRSSAGFDDYLDELTALRGRLRLVAGHINPPKASDAPCIDCNGTIVQRYRRGTTPETRGLDDIRECNRCGTTYTPVQYALAVGNRLEDVRNDPDRLLTAAEARVLWHLSEKQLYVWENRDHKLTHAGVDAQGHRLYRNGDIASIKRGRAA